MKKTAILLTLLLVVSSFAMAGCGRVYTEPNTGSMPRVVPHDLDVRFENCDVCHVTDQLSVTSISHASFTNDMCTIDGCHGELTYTEPSTSPVARPIPHIITAPLDDCTACHNPADTGVIIPHAAYTNANCLMVGCHATTTTPPPTTTSQPPTTTSQPPSSTTEPPPGTPPDTGSATPTDTAAGAPALTATALPLTGATHSAAVATLCLMCHGPGVGAQQFPLPPEWAGTTLTPGPWSVAAGSDADHTDRTDPATCIQAGCHAKNW